MSQDSEDMTHKTEAGEITPRTETASPETCAPCCGWKPLPGREHVIDDDGDVLKCREAPPFFDDGERREINVALRQALGQDMWNRLWGPELERLGGAVERLIHDAQRRPTAAPQCVACECRPAALCRECYRDDTSLLVDDIGFAHCPHCSKAIYDTLQRRESGPPPWPADVEIAARAAAYFPDMAALRKVAEAARAVRRDFRLSLTDEERALDDALNRLDDAAPCARVEKTSEAAASRPAADGPGGPASVSEAPLADREPGESAPERARCGRQRACLGCVDCKPPAPNACTPVSTEVRRPISFDDEPAPSSGEGSEPMAPPDVMAAFAKGREVERASVLAYLTSRVEELREKMAAGGEPGFQTPDRRRELLIMHVEANSLRREIDRGDHWTAKAGNTGGQRT